MKEKTKPIIIPEVGLIYGRDAIHVDNFKFKNNYTLEIHGALAVPLCSELDLHIKNVHFIKYQIRFNEIIYLQYWELDFYSDNRTGDGSSFEEVINSNLIKKFHEIDNASKINKDHKHFVFHTYDDIFEIIATGYKFELLR